MSPSNPPGTDRGTVGTGRIAAYGDWVYRNRWLVVVLSLFLVAGSAAGMGRLDFSTDYRAYFGAENPQLRAYDAMQAVYGRDDSILYVVKPDRGTVFTPTTLALLRTLTEKAWRIPFATRVDSPTNFQHSRAEDDELIVGDLVPKRGAITPQAAELARTRALGEPKLMGRLVARDVGTAMVAVTLTFPRRENSETLDVMAAAEDLQAAVRADFPGHTIVLTGTAPFNAAFIEAATNDMALLVPLMYAVLLVVLGLLLRSLAAVVVTLLVVAFSSASAMGLAGWLGVPLSPPVTIAPTIILTLAVADSVHLLVGFFSGLGHGGERRRALAETLRVNFQPVFLTSLTTAIGFASLNASDAPPYNALGTVTAIGVAAAWLYSVLFLPAFLAVVPVRARRQGDGRSPAMERLGEFVIRRRRGLLVAMAAVTIGLVAMIPRIDLNDQFVDYFDDSVAFRQATDFTMANLTGIYQAQWNLPAGETGGVSEPAYLRTLAAFTDWLRARPEVVHVDSLSDTLKRLNQNMHADDDAWYRLPDARDLAAQYLLLYEMSLPYGLDLNNQVNLDKSASRVVATLRNITTSDMSRLDVDASAWLAERFPNAPSIGASGAFVMFAYIAKRNIETMLVGTVTAFLLIAVVLIVALRSLRLGLLSLIPNMTPAAMAFGVWAVVVGQVGLAGSIIAATTLGIVVDDTVHFLSKYRRARRDEGLSPEDAVRFAFAKVGRALWVTTAVLVAGFAMLWLSAFQGNSVLGQLTALALILALATDFFLLPPLLLLLDRAPVAPAAPPPET